MRGFPVRATAAAAAVLLTLGLAAPADAALPEQPDEVFGSVEPIANPTVLDTRPLRDRDLAVREAFARRLVTCGVFDQVVDVLTSSGAIRTITDANTEVGLTAGGFAGRTNPAYGYTIDDDGPDGATHQDIEVLTNALGYVFSQGSAFLLDADDPSSFGFPANYAVLRFHGTPSSNESAALFETVGAIDPELFETDTSGYTQYGADYLTLQSDVPAEQFIAGYVAAAAGFGVEYLPVVDGEASLFQGGADFPANNWTTNPGGEQYLSRIPAGAHAGLAAVRQRVLSVTRQAVRVVSHGSHRSDRGTIHALGGLPCRTRGHSPHGHR